MTCQYQVQRMKPNRSLLLRIHNNTVIPGLLLGRLAGGLIPTADRFILLFVPLPHFGVSQVFLVLSLPGAVQAQTSVGFDDAAECHAGHLEEAVRGVSLGC
jgi:hypothetical protein